ncbi:hypothetical protein ACWEDZ_32295 [Streptomyces sp. NPDC005047]
MTDPDLLNEQLATYARRLHAALVAVITVGGDDEPALLAIRTRLNKFLDSSPLVFCRRCFAARRRASPKESRYFDPAQCTNADQPWHQTSTPLPAKATTDDLIGWLAAAADGRPPILDTVAELGPEALDHLLAEASRSSLYERPAEVGE